MTALARDPECRFEAKTRDPGFDDVGEAETEAFWTEFLRGLVKRWSAFNSLRVTRTPG